MKESVDWEKLDQDVQTVNSAVAIYQGMGGSLDGLSEPQRVLDKLKTFAQTDTVRRMPGLSGSMIDLRLEAVTTDGVPDDAFAEWDPAARKIVTRAVGTESFVDDSVDEFEKIENKTTAFGRHLARSKN